MASSRQAQGYLSVITSYLIMGMIGTLVSWSTAPESALLVIRFLTAGVVLSLVYARSRPFAAMLHGGCARRLLVMGICDAASLLLFFVAMREVGVAVGMLLMFLAPLWIAISAPLFFKSRTEPVVFPALGLALLGVVLVLAPSLSGGGARLTLFGVAAGLLAGLGYAAFQLLVKDLTLRLPAAVIVLAESWIDTLVLLPLALWQTLGQGHALTLRDLASGLMLGLICTALAYMLWTSGMRRIKVQHSSILGYLELVSSAVYALVFLGQGISPWTIAGGILIVLAGILLLCFGEREGVTPDGQHVELGAMDSAGRCNDRPDRV